MSIYKILITLFLMVSTIAFGQDFSETEPNNTALTANNTTLPKTLVGNFLVAGDLDYFKITTAESGVLTLNGTTTNASTLRFRVFDESQVELADKTSGGVSQPLILPCVVKAGTYYIQILNNNGQAFGTGGYRVQAFLDRSDICEYNGTFNTACAIPSTTTVNGKIWGIDGYVGRRSSNDNDIFKITPTRGGVLRLNLRQIADGQLPRLRIFNGLQQELVDKTATASVTSFAIAANIPEAGTYYIELTDYYGKQIDNLYALDVVFETSDNCEYNNNFTKACDYTMGQLYQGKICGFDGNTGAFSGADTDFFVFNATSTGLHNFRLTNFPTGSYMRIQIFNELQQVLSDATSGQTVNQFTNAFIIPRIGRYYVVIQEYYGRQFCDGLYRFQIGLATPTSDLKNDLSLSLSPNPATHQLFVELKNTESGIFRLQIADALGRIRTMQTVNVPQTTLSIADLPNGLYWLTITTTDGRQAVQKFVKQ